MLIVDRLKDTVEAKKESYEASAGMIMCLVAAAGFFLVGGSIWLAQFIGAILACLSFGSAFLLLALGFWLFSRTKSKDADKNISAAKQTVTTAVETATNTVQAITSRSKQPTIDAILAGSLLVLLLYLGGKKAIGSPFAEPHDVSL